jgi:hypothetical protein
MKNSLIKTIANGIGMAMGVTIITTNIINPLTAATVNTLLGIAVFALGLAALQKG